MQEAEKAGRTVVNAFPESEMAQKYRDMGCNVLWTASDKDFYMRGYNLEMDVLANIK